MSLFLPFIYMMMTMVVMKSQRRLEMAEEITYNYSNLANYGGHIIGSQYCVSHPVYLSIDKKVLNFSSTRYLVTSSADGSLIFKVDKFPFSYHGTLVVLDPAGNPVVTLRRKILSYHSRWQVFRGESTDENDFIFSVKRSSMFQFHTKLDVFLANNKAEEYPDFKLKGSYMETSCDIYAGNSSTPIAQMDKKLTAGSIFVGKHKFMVNMSPKVDYAMVVSLIIIYEEIATRRKQSSSSHQHHHHSDLGFAYYV